MPAYPSPTPFPGIAKLPSPLRGLAEAVFPQNDPAGEVMAPVAPMMAADSTLSAPARALINQLRKFKQTAMKEVEPLAQFAGERLHSILPSPPAFVQPAEARVPASTLASNSFPQSAREAGLVQEGHTGGFGRSPQNDFRHYEESNSLRTGAPSRFDARNLERGVSNLPEVRMYEQGPAVRSLEDLQGMGSGPSATVAPASAPGTDRYKTLIQDRGVTTMNKTRANAITTPDTVRAIRALVAEGGSIESIAPKYPNLKRATIYDIIKGHSWPSIK